MNEPHAAPARRVWRPFLSLSRTRALSSLQHRNFRLLWLGHSLTSMAYWMDQVSRGWLIYELTNSALQLGMVRGIQALPILFLSPVAGSAADRFSRKKQIVLSQIVDGCMYAALTLLIFTHAIKPWHVYLSAFVMAIDQTFLQPARAAIIADAVPRDHLTNAIGLNSMIFNTARSTGPALAGILIARYGTAGSYATQAIFCVLATLWTMQLRSRPQPSPTADDVSTSDSSFFRSVVEGWKFSWQNEEVRTGLLVVMLVALLIVPFTTLLPIFARDILSVGAAGQGLLLTGMGVGALGSAVVIASLGDRMMRGLFMLGGAALYGLSVVGFAASPWFRVSMVLMVIIGVANVFCNALVQTVIQTYSPSKFRGRTMAIFQLSNVVMTTGSMLLGTLATALGTQWAVGLMGAAGALMVLFIHVTLPRAWRIR
ncbi:MAG TPA: MFS transporter [Candidatus Binatia bacterium]|nr:MFS transporter [Candidatus Binatia bacterium]